MPIKGKQIIDNTIEQNKVFIQTDSIVLNDDVNNKEYLFSQLQDKINNMHYSLLNENMPALQASGGQKATNKAVIEFPISDIRVLINGEQVNVGQGLDCYFSPDNVTIRDGGNAEKGDYLYWNSNRYDLDTNDLIDFVYLVNYEYLVKDANSTITLQLDGTVVVKYIGSPGTTATVEIDGVNFTVGNVSGNFVWDIGGSNEHTFTSEGESITQVVNNKNYTIWYDGTGSLIFSIAKETEDDGSTPAPQPNLSAEPTSFSFDSSSHTDSISVTSNVSWQTTVSDEWISITSGSSGTDDGTIQFSVSENSTTDSRSATITISDVDNNADDVVVTIDQSGEEPELSASPTSFSFDDSDHSDYIDVTSNISWTADTADSWITITSGDSGTGDGTINFSVDENNDTTSRSGTITISDDDGDLNEIYVTIDQDGVTPYVDVSPTSFSFDSNSNSGSINVTSNVSWNAMTNSTWITFTTDSGTGDGTVEFNIDENTGNSPRSGTITVGDTDGTTSTDITVDQDGAPASLDVSPTSLHFDYSQGSDTVDVTSNVDWTASTSDNWISISNGSGSGNGTITIDVDENTEDNPRTGTVTVSDQAGSAASVDVTIDQDAAPV